MPRKTVSAERESAVSTGRHKRVASARHNGEVAANLPLDGPTGSRGRSSKQANGRVSGFDYSRLSSELEPRKIEQLKECEAQIAKLGQRSTEMAFARGERLQAASELIPERTFSEWVENACEFSRRHAYNFLGVATVLKPYKKRCIDARIPRSVLFKLISASPNHIEHVVGAFEAGRRLKGREVKAILVDGQDVEEKADVDLANVGGTAGLRALARAKTNHGIAEFSAGIKWMITDIEEALVPAQEGKRVLKGALVAKIEVPARLARAELENIAMFIAPNEQNSTAPHVVKFPEGSQWRRLADLLWDLGGREAWPSGPGFVPWLQDKVVPLLKWAVEDGRALKSTRAQVDN